MRASLLCDWQSVSWLNLGCKRCEGSGEVLTLEMSEDVALLPLHSLAGPGHCALPLEGWNIEISSRRGCPFCPPHLYPASWRSFVTGTHVMTPQVNSKGA